MSMTGELTVKGSSEKTYVTQQQQYNEGHWYQGFVKFYKDSGGYGFLKVYNFPDVFFHMKDLRRNHVSVGDKFTFTVQRQSTYSNNLYRVHSVRGCIQSDNVVRNKSDARYDSGDCSYTSHKNGNSGSLLAIPHPRDLHVLQQSKRSPTLEVTPRNGEIVAKDLNARKIKGFFCHKKSKPINMKPGMMKLGPVYNVPIVRREPIIVSATGQNSAEMAPKPENPEVQKLKEVICKKATILRSLNLAKLPDGGRRLRDDINALEVQLRDLIIKEKPDTISKNATNVGKDNDFAPTKLDTEKTSVFKCSFDNWSLPHHSLATGIQKGSVQPIAGAPATEKKLTPSKLDFPNKDSLGTKMGWAEFGRPIYDPIQFGDEPLFGGRMTSARLTEVRKITKAAIEDLHRSLSSRPEPDGQLDDPARLKVPLMLHQKQALAWLVWREAQAMSGGILADDMGLGKTLTMISLILKQVEYEEVISRKEDYDIQDFNSSTDSRDSESEVVLVEDKKDSVNDEFVKKDETCFDSKTDKKKSSLVASASTLIIAPASLLFHWEKEIRNRCEKGLLSIHLFHGSTREKEPTRLAEFDVVITTYDIVRRCGSAMGSSDQQEATLMQINWRRIILDEAHQIKNYKSQSSEAVCKLEARTRWAVTGTPVQNNLTDMYAMLKFLHCRPFDEYKVWKNQVDNKTSKGEERLKTLISCIVLRREKSSTTPSGVPLVSLPERTFVIHTLKLSGIESEVYDKLQSDSKAAFRKFQENKKGNSYNKNTVKPNTLAGVDTSSTVTNSNNDSVNATTLLVMLLRLRQCCGHLSLLKESFSPELLSNEKNELALEDVFQTMDINKTPVKMADVNAESFVAKDKAKFFEKSSMSGKLEFVLDELNKLRFEKPDDKCVIISQWTSMLEVIAYHLEKAQISYAIIKGSVSAKKRMDMVNDFNTNPGRPKVMLLSLRAGGVGLNLIGGNHLYLLDMHWNPALESQAFDRIYRLGQKKPVFVHKFVVEGTVEEKILKLQEHKLSLARAVMQGVGSEDCKKLTLQDMKLLFGI